MINRIYAGIVALFMIALPLLSAAAPITISGNSYISPSPKVLNYAHFKELAPEISDEALQFALEGYSNALNNGRIESPFLTVIDFSKPSTEKRIWVLNLEKGEISYHNYVSHGRNSGQTSATKFSNKPESYQSSLGFYKTAQTYYGKHGFSLRLEGLEQGINQNAYKRAIVMHSAAYANESFIRKYGRLGRSLGCPAVPQDGHEALINLIKDGSLIFIYHPSPEYFNKTQFIKPSHI